MVRDDDEYDMIHDKLNDEFFELENYEIYDDLFDDKLLLL